MIRNIFTEQEHFIFFHYYLVKKYNSILQEVLKKTCTVHILKSILYFKLFANFGKFLFPSLFEQYFFVSKQITLDK